MLYSDINNGLIITFCFHAATSTTAGAVTITFPITFKNVIGISVTGQMAESNYTNTEKAPWHAASRACYAEINKTNITVQSQVTERIICIGY